MAGKNVKKRSLKVDIPDFAANGASPVPDDFKSETSIVIAGQTYSAKASDFQLESFILGRGRYGTVYRAKHIPSNVTMAIKLIQYNADPEHRKEQELLLRELDVSARATSCPYIVHFYGALFWDGDVWMCLECMDTSLDKLYKALYARGQSIPEDIVGRIAYCVVQALHYLHGLNIIHRDVKPSNVLINRDGQVKLCDFGISGTLVNSLVYSLDVGAQAYMAPEKINPDRPDRQSYDIRSDVWSLGISLIELATGHYPYTNTDSVFRRLQEIVYGPSPTLPSGKFTHLFEDFVNKCLAKDSSDRPKFVDLLMHPFIVQYETKEVDVAGFVASAINSFGEAIQRA